MSKRTTHRSTSGSKLYAERDKDGQFTDIQSYKKAHGQDVKRRSKAETAAKRKKKSKQISKSVDVYILSISNTGHYFIESSGSLDLMAYLYGRGERFPAAPRYINDAIENDVKNDFNVGFYFYSDGPRNYELRGHQQE